MNASERYPEHYKVYTARADAAVISVFIDWLRGEEKALRRHLGSTESLLNRYFKIDTDALKRETEAIKADPEITTAVDAGINDLRDLIRAVVQGGAEPVDDARMN